MKRITIVSTLIAIFCFAGAASAQHVKVVDGAKLGPSREAPPPAEGAQIYRNVNGTWTLLGSHAGGGQSVLAGSTVRLRIASTNNRGKLIVGVDSARIGRGAPSGKLFVATEVGVYQVPCDGESTKIGVDSGSQLTISGPPSEPVLNWKTAKEWSGTCRILAVKLRDGTEVRAKVLFE